MNTPARAAAKRYGFATGAITASAVALMVDVFYLHPGTPSTQQKALGLLLVLLGIYAQVSLRGNHAYYKKSAAQGCAPAKEYASGLFGIGFLMETARAIQSHRLLQLRYQQLHELGHTFQARLFPETCRTILTDEPDNVKAVLSTKFDDWIIPEHRIKGFLPILGYHSIFQTNGPEWQHSRAMLRPAFVRDQISDLQCFDRHISKLINRIPKDGSRFDLQALFGMLTIDTISDFMFGQTTDILESSPERELKFGSFFDASLVKVARRARLGWVTQIFPDRELNEHARFIRHYVDDFIERKKRHSEHDPVEKAGQRYVFLDELLKSGEPDEVIRNQLLSIFLAGRDTTTSVLTSLFFELSRRPDVVSLLQQEIQEFGLRDPTWEQLKTLKYLNWAIKEALRLSPPVPSNARDAARDTVLPTGGGADGKSPIFVAKGTALRYQVWSMHRRKDLYGSDAEEFRPERWENLKVSFEYVPFNAGPRICIGQQFALTQMALITFRLLQAFKSIERKDDRPPLQRLAINTSMLYGCWVSMIPA
ncbi:cytochrome P450 [Xylariales sp. AK1849]|nr:cytochrome P450 [Xylariales sp. AK1849]